MISSTTQCSGRPARIAPMTEAVRPNGVAKIKRFKLKPISEEQAREQMDALGHAFFLFLNEDTQELNLLYRRNNGTLGLVEADLS